MPRDAFDEAGAAFAARCRTMDAGRWQARWQMAQCAVAAGDP